MNDTQFTKRSSTIRRISAWLMLLIGGSVAISGCVVAAGTGSDNTAGLRSYQLPGTTRAFRANLFSTGHGQGRDGERTFGSYRVRLETNGTAGRLAVVPKAEADAYLLGVPVADAGTVIPFVSSVHIHHIGPAYRSDLRPLQSPTPDDWAVSDTTTTAAHSTVTLVWPMRKGSYTLMALSATASPLRGSVHVYLDVPHSFIVGMSAATGGAALLILGTTILIRSGSRTVVS